VRRGAVEALVSLLISASVARAQVSAVDPAVGAGHGHSGPETYGTTVPGYFAIDAWALTPMTSSVQHACANNCQLRYISNGTGYQLAAPVRLPAGAVVQYIELDYYDASVTGIVQAVLADCDYSGEACNFVSGSCGLPLSTLCSGVGEATGYGSVNFLFSNGIQIDNYNRRYFVWVGNSTTDGTTAFSLITIGYLLQVSPAPSVATFNDVPTSHPFFQFVEALAASGITGGCGGGNYCPDAPLTRGQMAVFLAKALGLHFP
jgi:hypothetical protein